MPIDLNDDAIASLERATLDAVAPVERDALGAWLIPYDRSTIGRATSAVPTRHQGIEISTLHEIEARYAQRGLPCAFRIADVPGLARLATELQVMGYTPNQPTLTLVADIRQLLALQGSAQVQVESTASAAWASVYTAKGFDPVDGANRVQALTRSTHVVYATVMGEHGAVAAGTASMSHGWAGIHGMRTVVAARGQGHAASILLALAHTATQHQTKRVFLQVEDGNAPALALYQRAGFLNAWRYHYWRKPKTP